MLNNNVKIKTLEYKNIINEIDNNISRENNNILKEETNILKEDNDISKEEMNILKTGNNNILRRDEDILRNGKNILRDDLRNMEGKNNDTIIIEHNKRGYKYVIYDNNKRGIGGFNILQLIKYINKRINNFMEDVEIEKSYDIIEKYICYIIKINERDNDKNKHVEIKLIPHIDSQFMGNIEMIIKLYNDIIKCDINKYLISLSFNDFKIIKYNINQLNYLLLNKILRLASYISDNIKDKDMEEYKKRIISYSTYAMYKITNLIQNELNNKIVEFNNYKYEINRLSKTTSTIYEKIELIQKNIENQNKYIDEVISNRDIMKSNIIGGGIISSSSINTIFSDSSNIYEL